MSSQPATLLLLVTEDWYLASHRLPLIRAACEAGWRVIAATRVQSHRQDIEDAGAEVLPLDMRREGTNPLHELRTIHALTAHYRQLRPDVVHHVGLKPILYGGWAARRAGVPNVIQAFAGMGALYTDRGRGEAPRRILDRLLRGVVTRRGVQVLVQNPADAALLITRGVAREEQVRIVRGSGVDLQAFRCLPPPGGIPIVMLPGRMLRDKGVEDFVNAARALGGRARFVLVGGIDPANPTALRDADLQRWVTEGVVEWWGHRPDMPSVMAASSVVVLPSYREGMPKALLEAAASGRPVVATDVPGCRDAVVDGVTGILVPARNPPELANAIRILLDDADLRMTYGKAARMLAEREFADMSLARQILAIYEEMVR